MRIKSPLTNITDVLGQVKDSADIYDETLRTNESATRAVLIDPVLRMLGWDTGNPFMVEVEKPIDKGRVDYALFSFNQEIEIIIEAKKLGADLNDKDTFLSLVKYAFSSGVKDIFLTDGLIWHHFTDFEPGKQDATKTLSLADEDLVEIAAYMVQRLDSARYWPEEKNVEELSQHINQLESEMSVLQLELTKLQKLAIDSQTPITPLPQDSKDRIIQTHEHKSDFVELSSIGNATRTKPSELLLPDGASVSVKTWTEVLTHCCMFAMNQNPEISLPFKDAAGKKVSLLALARPPRGITYYEVDYQGKNIFLRRR